MVRCRGAHPPEMHAASMYAGMGLATFFSFAGVSQEPPLSPPCAVYRCIHIHGSIACMHSCCGVSSDVVQGGGRRASVSSGLVLGLRGHKCMHWRISVDMWLAWCIDVVVGACLYCIYDGACLGGACLGGACLGGACPTACLGVCLTRCMSGCMSG